jgi:uncharacterized Zn-binding protein involved in type VI secretion
MQKLSLLLGTLVLGTLVGGSPIMTGAAARADGTVTTLNFAVTRNGDQIGSTTVKLQRNGDQTIAETETNVQVKIAFITVYRYEQRLTERWVGGKLTALSAVTDDNGSIHRVSATRAGDKLSVNADGKVSQVDPAMVPANLWNASLVRTSAALDPKDGSVTPVSVVDRGREQLIVQGRALTAHRYSIKTTIPQEVWYDEQQHLLKVELRGSDGSTINTTRSAT